jgi:hypothetical protein
MIDMTNNRVPYGLLTDEEKAALHEHEKAGGKVEYWTGAMWYEAQPHPTFGCVYRTVPLPKTQDVIAWEKLPDWAEWVARDMDGTVFIYDAPPDLRGDDWVSRFAVQVQGPINDFPGIVQIGTCDWTDSKQRRPR